jgi:hypothetical protein
MQIGDAFVSECVFNKYCEKVMMFQYSRTTPHYECFKKEMEMYKDILLCQAGKQKDDLEFCTALANKVDSHGFQIEELS